MTNVHRLLDQPHILIDNSEHPFRSKTALHVLTSLDVYPANVPADGVTLANSVDQQLDRLAPNVGFRAVEKPTPGQIPVFAVATQHTHGLSLRVVAQLDVSGIEFAAKDQGHLGEGMLYVCTA